MGVGREHLLYFKNVEGTTVRKPERRGLHLPAKKLTDRDERRTTDPKMNDL